MRYLIVALLVAILAGLYLDGHKMEGVCKPAYSQSMHARCELYYEAYGAKRAGELLASEMKGETE